MAALRFLQRRQLNEFFRDVFTGEINMDPNSKIVFIHQRNSWYLPYALYQAHHSSPDSQVVF